jgi:hypothetical protein
LNLHIGAAGVSHDRPANARQVIEDWFIDCAGGGAWIKPVTEVLFLHYANQMAQRVEVTGCAIHGENKFPLTRQQPRLPGSTHEHLVVWKWICRSIDTQTADH